MKAKIEIKMDNAAFDENAQELELVEILRRLIEKIQDHGIAAVPKRNLHDSNGNRVGEFKVIS